MANQELSPCSFGSDGRCGSLGSTKTVFSGDDSKELRHCNHDISMHIYRLLHTKEPITETELIINRFQTDHIPDDSTICPYNRYNLGIGYRPSQKCVHPNHKGRGKGISKTVNQSTSDLAYANYRVRLKIGDGLCRKCREDTNLKADQGNLGMNIYFFRLSTPLVNIG